MDLDDERPEVFRDPAEDRLGLAEDELLARLGWERLRETLRGAALRDREDRELVELTRGRAGAERDGRTLRDREEVAARGRGVAVVRDADVLGPELRSRDERE